MRILASLVFAAAIVAGPAAAQPALPPPLPYYEFACPEARDVQRITLGENNREAVVSFRRAPEVVLSARGRGERPPGPITFGGSGMTFVMRAPTAELTRPGQATARCLQDELSQAAVALPNGPRRQWPAHRAPGFASDGAVRAAPSTDAARLTAFTARTPVVILRNANVFREGFFWFEVEWGEAQRGFMWGGLLCTNDPARDLAATLRRC
jgi:hypothetical protein